MRINTNDLTLKRNYLQTYRLLIKDYELLKQGLHPKFKLAKEFYEAHHTDRRSFLKYYNRFALVGVVTNKAFALKCYCNTRKALFKSKM